MIYQTYVYMSSAMGVYKKQEQFTIREHLSSSPVIWWDPSCSSFSFLCFPIVCIYVLSAVLSLPPVVCSRAHVLFTLFVFVCA